MDLIDLVLGVLHPSGQLYQFLIIFELPVSRLIEALWQETMY
jgi:hypothetical protein